MEYKPEPNHEPGSKAKPDPVLDGAKSEPWSRPYQGTKSSEFKSVEPISELDALAKSETLGLDENNFQPFENHESLNTFSETDAHSFYQTLGSDYKSRHNALKIESNKLTGMFVDESYDQFPDLQVPALSVDFSIHMDSGKHKYDEKIIFE